MSRVARRSGTWWCVYATDRSPQRVFEALRCAPAYEVTQGRKHRPWPNGGGHEGTGENAEYPQ